MIISFTGTRTGMTLHQIMVFSKLLYEIGITKLIHGDCIGADADAHVIALEQGLAIEKRPGNIKKYRAFTDGGLVIAEPEYPTIRNKKIVNDSEQLIACPRTHEEEVRSGTWATIRYARFKNKPIIIIWPDGTFSVELN